MTTTYTNSMFDQIRSAMTKESAQSGGKYREIMKLEPGNIYTVRLVPNLQDPENTFWRYYTHAWESFSTGQYISAVSPTTWGDKDPIAEARYALYKHGTEEEQEKAKKVIRRENWLANIYVVNDPVNSDNNGKVKLLRFGKQLHKIIMEAMEGDDSDEFGARIFDLSSNGCNFKIKVERQGEFPTYVSSRFASPSKIKDLDVDEVYSNVHELDKVFAIKSYGELKQVLDEHFYCKDPADSAWDPEPEEDTKKDSSKPGDKPSTSSADDVDPLDDDKVKELLDGLGD